MKQILARIFFGKPAQGTKVTTPVLRTLSAQNRPSENEWYQAFRVSSRYGTRGSFYGR